jgi:hypothetical protein
MSLVLLTSLDNLRAGFALGLLPMSARQRGALVVAFAVAELGMSLLGARFAVPGLGPVAVVVAAALALLGVVVRAPVARLGLLLSPLLFAFDNLAAGVGDARSAVIAGLAGGLFSALGLAGGAILGDRAPRLGLVLGGAGLFTLVFAG